MIREIARNTSIYGTYIHQVNNILILVKNSTYPCSWGSSQPKEVHRVIITQFSIYATQRSMMCCFTHYAENVPSKAISIAKVFLPVC